MLRQMQSLAHGTNAKTIDTSADVKPNGLFSAANLSKYLGFEALNKDADLVEASVGTDWLSDLDVFSNIFGKNKAAQILMRLEHVPVNPGYFELTDPDSVQGISRSSNWKYRNFCRVLH